ncbi:hypothetical protein [Rhizobium metallidurans]|uniref:Uncharacterized protein n=1 Tax=Rhizobium metallidurans TaxID=1265931 RepID=A0A7W6CPV1_9HYPH|nr:hypothetical protein [Rhizobium metallidurans]MBB3962827.1 hypothetical protein [Rhizobium metallidurans]
MIFAEMAPTARPVSLEALSAAHMDEFAVANSVLDLEDRVIDQALQLEKKIDTVI